jgi:hypothetical protein
LIRLHLLELSEKLTGSRKVRLLLSSDGKLTSKVISLGNGAKVEPVRVGLAATAVNMNDIWLYHKTTHCRVYDESDMFQNHNMSFSSGGMAPYGYDRNESTCLHIVSPNES